jgi:trehalose transport system substrate-binding protein
MRARFGPLLALFAALSLVAAACGGDGAQAPESPIGGGADFTGVSITFSTSLAEEEKAAVEEVLGMFADATGAEVALTQVESADLPQKLTVEVDSGNHTIHLFAQDNLALRALVDQNLVEDLSAVEIPAGVNPALVPEQFDGKQFFLPYRPNVRVAYVNSGRFDEAGTAPPATVEELMSVAEQLKSTAGGQPKVTLSLAEGDPAAVTISEWIVSYGGNPLIINDEGSVQAFTTLQSMWQQDLLARESLQAKFDTEVDYLQGETAWLAQNWPFTSGVLADQGLLEQFQVYAGWSGPARAAHVVGGEVLGIPRGVSGQQLDAAIELATFLMSREAQEVLVGQNAWPSVRDDALTQVPEEQQQTFEAIQAALADGWYRPNVAYWADASQAMNDAIQRIMVNGEAVQTVLDELHGDIEAAAQAAGAEYPPPSS